MSFIFKNYKKNPNAKMNLENSLYIPIIQILDLIKLLKFIDIKNN